MNPDRWPDVELLYEKLIALPLDQRAAAIDEACLGDDDLRREVESLLGFETGAAGFLEQPALRAAADSLSRALPHLQPPEVPGYHIIRELGEGGMGVVYLAEQQEPLHRTVALKLIRPGMDSRQVLARFERERQALARMDHPHIAAVFDAGSTEDGRPYFVMEFVDGVSITEYCDSRHLSIRARLALFIQICNAVQHAHQKGVIHRDLKPSNVLVIEQDGRALPKVIDFGTAKSTDPASAENTLTTDGLVFGTVEYMSPEQAAFSSDIDTTTDVYSLGVLLYELLVGRTPFNRRKVEMDSVDAVLRAIRDSDPPRPSSLVSRDKDFVASVAASGTDVGVLARQLSGDLDWIVLKALEKDRRRRYLTAASLGVDVLRFLESRPIEARPPSVPYRIRKFTRRYRGAVAAAVGVAAALLLGLAVSTTLYWRAERKSAEADQQRNVAESQRKTADAATLRSLEQQAEAERFRELAEQQGLAATASADSLRVANGELEYRTYVATIAAADAEVRGGKLSSARQRLLAIEAVQRKWEWWYLFNQTVGSVFMVASATPACTNSQLLAPGETTQVLGVDPRSGDIVLRRCAVVETWTASGAKGDRHESPLTKEIDVLRVPLTKQTVLAVEPKSKARVVASLRGSEWSIRLAGARSTVELGQFRETPECADVAPDGQHVAIGFKGLLNSVAPPSQTFEVWRIGVGLIRRFEPPPIRRNGFSGTANGCHVKFSPDGKFVASSKATVDVWNAESEISYFRDTERPGNDSQPVAFSPTGDRLAIGRPNGSISLVQMSEPTAASMRLDDGRTEDAMESAAEMARGLNLVTRSRAIVALAFSPDGSMLASAAGKAVTAWDLVPQKSRVRAEHETDVVGVAISVDGRFVYSVDTSGQLRTWPVRLSPVVTQSPFMSYGSFPVLVDRKATVIAGIGSDEGVSILRLPDLQLTELRAGSGKLAAGRSPAGGALSTDGTRLFVTDPNNVVRILTLPEGRTLHVGTVPRCELEAGLPSAFHVILKMAVSPGGRYFAAGQPDCVSIIETETLRLVVSLPLRDGHMPRSLVFRHDGVLLVATTNSREVGARPRIEPWDWKANKRQANVYPRDEDHPPSTYQSVLMAPSSDGQTIGILFYGLSSSGTLSIWDRDLKKRLGRMPVGDGSAAALSPDGSRAVIVSRENPRVQIWDTARSSLLLTLLDTDAHTGVTFTDAGQIVAGRLSGGITIWNPRLPASR